MEITILADRSGYNEAVNDEKVEWMNELLSYFGLDLSEVHRGDRPDLVEYYLDDNNIEIIDYPEMGAVKVLYKQELVGEWLGATEVILKEDAESNGLYYEIHIEYWSIMEDEINS